MVFAEPHCVHKPAPRPIDYLLPFLVLKIERDALLLNGQPVNPSEMANAVITFVQTRASTTIHVLVDPKVDYGRVISILRLIPKRSTMRTIILTPGAMHDLGDNFCWFRDASP
jgi:biopolymer transport protein ExbD